MLVLKLLVDQYDKVLDSKGDAQIMNCLFVQF